MWGNTKIFSPRAPYFVGSGYEKNCVRCTPEKGFLLPDLHLITLSWISTLW